MIRIVQPTDELASPILDKGFSRPQAAPERHPSAAPQQPSAFEVEQEITRLTWAVLDGAASLADRERLAELVRSQHRPRR